MSSPSYGALIAQQGPTLYWPLDEPSGAVAFDRSPAPTYHGAYVGGPTLGAAGPPLYDGAGAVALNGSTQSVSTSALNPFVNGTVRTFGGLALRTSTADFQALVKGSGGAAPADIYLMNSQNVQFYPNDNNSAVFAGAWPGANIWAHWALIFDEPSDAVSLYINGRFVSTQAMTFAYGAGMTGVQVGPGLPGSLAHFAIWTRALTPAEIMAQAKASMIQGSPMGGPPV